MQKGPWNLIWRDFCDTIIQRHNNTTLQVRASYPSLQANAAFVPTPSATDDIKFDEANIQQVTAVFLHCVGESGEAEVILSAQPFKAPDTEPQPVTVYLTQGQTLPFAVRRLVSTATDVLAVYGGQNI